MLKRYDQLSQVQKERLTGQFGDNEILHDDPANYIYECIPCGLVTYRRLIDRCTPAQLSQVGLKGNHNDV